MKKKEFNTNYILLTIGILFLLYLYLVIFAPFSGVITEERPILKFLCDMQVKCNSNKGLMQCGYSDYTPKNYHTDYNFSKEFEYISWYKGCNNLTKGYTINDGGLKYIDNVEVCGCGAWWS